MKRERNWRIRIVAGLSAASLLALGPAPRAEAKRPVARKAAATAPVRVLAWKVRPKAAPGAKPDYLVGTAHITIPKGVPVSRDFLRALAGCDRFMVEADLDEVTPEVVARYIVLEEGESLDALLPETAWVKLKAAASPMGLGPEQLSRLEPWYLSMLLTLPSATPERLLDAVLAQSATQRKLAIGYLETADDVLGAMDAVDDKEGLGMLVEALDDLESQRRQAKAVETAYLRGDLAAIEKVLFDAERMSRYPDFFERLLYARNRNWLPKVESALQNTDAMIAVGLGHLVGAGGLLRTLEKQGYKVEAVRL